MRTTLKLISPFRKYSQYIQICLGQSWFPAIFSAFNNIHFHSQKDLDLDDTLCGHSTLKAVQTVVMAENRKKILLMFQSPIQLSSILSYTGLSWSPTSFLHNQYTLNFTWKSQTCWWCMALDLCTEIESI